MKLKICTSMVVLFMGWTTQAQQMDKKFHTLHVSMKINASADRVWEAMVLDYGEISNFSPYIFASNYENGSLKGVEGAERKCFFNKKGSRWSHERIMAIDVKNKTMHNSIIDAQKFPLDLDNSQAFYRAKDNGDGTSTASYEFQFRTKPAFMGGRAKGKFKKTLEGTLIC
ncbi:MAG: SRPBCC family protein [Flavobacteriaceae bacterium]|nr:SRPBCC family protein [Flavobacteriaceae bacterium]